MALPEGLQLAPGNLLINNGNTARLYQVVAVDGATVYACRFAVVKGIDFKDWLVVAGAGIGRAPVPLKPETLKLLREGDRLRHTGEADAMIIVSKDGSDWEGFRLLLSRTLTVTNPSEWTLVAK